MKVKKGKGNEWKIYAEKPCGKLFMGIHFAEDALTQKKLNEVFKAIKEAMKDIEP